LKLGNDKISLILICAGQSNFFVSWRKIFWRL